MNRKVINIVSCIVAFAVVMTSGVFLFRHFNAKENIVILNNIPKETTTQKTEEETEENITQEADEKEETTQAEEVTENIVTTTYKTTQNIQVQTTVPVTDKAPTISEETVKKEAGTLGFMWNEKDQVFYSAKDPWQRAFGYNEIYDFGAQFVVIYFDTVRIKFNYEGYDWMVQLWKGQYGFVLLGAEVGVYYKHEGMPVEHYVCTDNSKRLKVGYTCYDHDEVLFTRTYQDTWWLTGFVPGKLDKFNDRSEMAMQLRITLKSSAMKNAFVEGLKKCGFTQGSAKSSNPDTYYTKNNDVYIYWQYITQN